MEKGVKENELKDTGAKCADKTYEEKCENGSKAYVRGIRRCMWPVKMGWRNL